MSWYLQIQEKSALHHVVHIQVCILCWHLAARLESSHVNDLSSTSSVSTETLLCMTWALPPSLSLPFFSLCLWVALTPSLPFTLCFCISLSLSLSLSVCAYLSVYPYETTMSLSLWILSVSIFFFVLCLCLSNFSVSPFLAAHTSIYYKHKSMRWR
jgi:hypothetical protein